MWQIPPEAVRAVRGVPAEDNGQDYLNGIAYDSRCVIICNPVLVIIGRLQTLNHKINQSGKKDGIFFRKCICLIKDRSGLLSASISFLFC